MVGVGICFVTDLTCVAAPFPYQDGDDDCGYMAGAKIAGNDASVTWNGVSVGNVSGDDSMD